MSKPILPNAPNAAHTPGPWHVEQLEDDYGFMPIYGVWHPESNSGENTVCNVFSIADAMLIAAAPDLLAVCQKVRYLYAHAVAIAHGTNGEMNQKMALALLEEFDAATAKAQGESR